VAGPLYLLTSSPRGYRLETGVAGRRRKGEREEGGKEEKERAGAADLGGDRPSVFPFRGWSTLSLSGNGLSRKKKKRKKRGERNERSGYTSESLPAGNYTRPCLFIVPSSTSRFRPPLPMEEKKREKERGMEGKEERGGDPPIARPRQSFRPAMKRSG